MKEWTYLGKNYKTVTVDWDTIYNSGQDLESWMFTEYPRVSLSGKKIEGVSDIYRAVVYHNKWDKCYTIARLGVFGNGTRVKFGLEDIQTKRFYYAMPKDIELVIEID